jgi:hypothetical protein
MDKYLDVLVEDIYDVLDSSKEHTFTGEIATMYGTNMTEALIGATEQRNKPREKGKLWASDLGKPCLRQHWYNFNGNTTKEQLEGHTKFKFLYGNLLEEAALYLGEEAGHQISHQQERVEWKVNDTWTVSGRIDAVIDGVLVDVKSTSSYGFKRYKDGITPLNDTFGYLYQVGFYLRKNEFDPKPTEGGFLWVDKGNGHLLAQRAVVPSEGEIEARTEAIIKAVDQPEDEDVPRHYAPKPYGKSGNHALDTACSYCAHKVQCWRSANGGQGLRGFIYGHGPVWFTDVVREPKVPEIGDNSE